MKSMKIFRRKNGTARNISFIFSLALLFNMVATMPLMAYSIVEYAARIDPAGLGRGLSMAATIPAVAQSVVGNISIVGTAPEGGGGAMMVANLIELEITIPGHYETQQVWVPGTEGTNGIPGYYMTQPMWVPEQTVIIKVDPEDLSTQEPINTTTGNNYFRESRLFVPCPGISLEVGLKYQSVTSNPEGRLGKGWHHSYEWTLDDQNTEVVIHTAAGGKVIFESLGNGQYEPPAEGKWELETTANGYEATLSKQDLVYSFAANGQLSSIQDAWGTRVDCLYGTNDCLELVAHANGRQIAISNAWNVASGEWRVADMRVHGGTSLAFGYNTDGQLAQVVEQVGANSFTSSYQYADGFLTHKINGAGFEYTYEYEEENGTLNGKGTYLDVDGYYEHDVDYFDAFATDVTYHRRGQEQIFRYSRNNQGKPETTYGPVASIQDIEQRGKRYAYAENGMDTAEETLFDDATGAAWSKWMLYDDAHNVTNFGVSYGTANPVQLLSMEYDLDSQLATAVVDTDNLRLEVIYTNGLPRIEKAFYSSTNSYDTHYTYTTNGLVQTVTNANGHVSSFEYDAMGNMISAGTELGPIATNTFDALGFLESAEILSEDGISTGRITQYGRDTKGRLTQTTFADGLTNSFSYNALGYLTNSVDRAGRHTDYTYAPVEKLTSVTKYLKQGGTMVPVRIGYDLDEQVNVLRVAEPSGRYVESYQLDIKDRITSVTNIEDQVMDIDYSVGGFVTQITRFDGSSLTNIYDNAGRKENTTLNPDSASPLTIGYSYYIDGLLESISDGASSITNTYDRLNRLTNVVSSVGNSTFEIHYSHDPVGNLMNSVGNLGGSCSVETAYTYDEAEWLTEISTTEGSEVQSFVYSYSPENSLVERVSNTISRITCSYSYDIMGRATNITYRTANDSLIHSLDYAYNVSSMITNKTIVDDASNFVSHSYEYDSINRLVGEVKSNSVTSASSVVKYSYDLAGNRLTKTTDGIGVAYALGDGNRLASARTAAIIDLNGTSNEAIGTDERWGELWVSNLNAGIGYVPQTAGTDFWVDDLAIVSGTNQLVAAIRDQAGNTDYTTNIVFLSATSTNMQYAYDAAGCLMGITNIQQGTPNVELELEWDERYRLTSAVQDSVFDIQYSYDVLDRRISRIEGSITNYFVYNGSQIVADLDGNGDLLRTYAWGMGIDNLLSFTDHTTSNTFYAIKDHQNTVIALVDEAGVVVEAYEYDAYGKTTVFDASDMELTESALGNRYLFQGREYDFTTGLYCFRARWYDPNSGRWLSKDPKGIAGGLNLYVAFGNNPVNFIDPFGLYETAFSGGTFEDNYRGDKGYWNVGGSGIHGTGGYFTDGNGTEITAEEVYAQMKVDGYEDGTPIKLYICEAGISGGSAEKLAELAKASVTANTGTIYLSKGLFGIIDEYADGKWRIILSCGGSE